MPEDWKPFEPDEHTVALYHFDEGQGNEAHDACGDPELTLRAHKLTIIVSNPFPASVKQTREHSSQKIGVLSRRTNDVPNN